MKYLAVLAVGLLGVFFFQPPSLADEGKYSFPGVEGEVSKTSWEKGTKSVKAYLEKIKGPGLYTFSEDQKEAAAKELTEGAKKVKNFPFVDYGLAPSLGMYNIGLNQGEALDSAMFLMNVNAIAWKYLDRDGDPTQARDWHRQAFSLSFGPIASVPNVPSQFSGGGALVLSWRWENISIGLGYAYKTYNGSFWEGARNHNLLIPLSVAIP